MYDISQRELTLVKDELRIYQTEEIFDSSINHKVGKINRIDYCWYKEFQISLSSGAKKYFILRKVLKSCLALPNRNANVEISLTSNKNLLTNEHLNWSKKVLLGLRRTKEYSCGYGGAPNFLFRRESSAGYIFLVHFMFAFVTIMISSDFYIL